MPDVPPKIDFNRFYGESIKGTFGDLTAAVTVGEWVTPLAKLTPTGIMWTFTSDGTVPAIKLGIQVRSDYDTTLALDLMVGNHAVTWAADTTGKAQYIPLSDPETGRPLDLRGVDAVRITVAAEGGGKVTKSEILAVLIGVIAGA